MGILDKRFDADPLRPLPAHVGDPDGVTVHRKRHRMTADAAPGH